jgi:Rrf2 family protein
MALARLAREYGNEPVLIRDIARDERIPQRFLENILLELKRQGWINSRLGKSGGYYLIREPREVCLSDIVRIFEGSIGMLCCVSEHSYQPCEFFKNEEECKIRKVFFELREASCRILSQKTLNDLI